MQIIPVLDLAHGVAVHARGGNRRQYSPIESVLVPDRPGDALALLQAYHGRLGASECYVADLDAIQGGPIQRVLLRACADVSGGFAGALMVDAGAGTAGDALEVVASGAGQVVVGLETLRAFADLRRIVDAVGPTRTVFSLDLRLDNPIVHPAMQDVHGAAAGPLAIAEQARASGAATLLVIDLGRVGTGCGVDVGLVESLRRHLPDVRLLVGGGVVTVRDLERMRDAGCDGLLLASALHAGRVTAADIRSAVADGHQPPASTSR